MRAFEKDGKYNFVDDNNVLVGFDAQCCCCENFGWMVSKEIPPPDELNEREQNKEYEGFNFDTSFINKQPSGMDCGEQVSFRMTKGGDILYLTLWNHHNGYYSHGFDMLKDSHEIFRGSL